MPEIYLGAIKPEKKPTDFQYGANTGIEKILLFPNGQLDYLSIFEKQSGLYETYWCVSASLANRAEILTERMMALGLFSKRLVDFINKHYLINGRVRFSTRHLAVRSGTNPNVGNSGDAVAWSARHRGLCPLDLCPWDLNDKTKTKADLYDASTISKEADAIALEWASLVDLQYEWVWRRDFEDASKYGVVQVYTEAWHKDDNGLYYNPNPLNTNHAIGYLDKKPFIEDTYPPQVKQMRSLEDLYTSGLKINMTEKTMKKPKLEDNTLIQLVSGEGGFGMYLDGFIFVDDVAKILATWLIRTNGKTEGMIKPLVQEQWDMFVKKNLKRENLN